MGMGRWSNPVAAFIFVFLILLACQVFLLHTMYPRNPVAVDPCSNQRIYMYHLPSQFNQDLISRCNYSLVSWLNFCPHVFNHGFGVPLNNSLLGDGWYATNFYVQEVIFHSRIQNYRCLTSDVDAADAFFIPYYVGYDAIQYIYNNIAESAPKHGLELVKWLRKNAQYAWSKYGGLDHFMVMSRVSWDLIASDYGTRILALPEMANITGFFIDRNPWQSNQVAVSYPTSFHPTAPQLWKWMRRMRSCSRKYFIAFAGGIRSTMPEVVRTTRKVLLDQCLRSNSCINLDCKELRCSSNQGAITQAFMNSIFCLQPRGDSPTRRSIFDAMVAGCIPVFLHKDSAYTQYIWHLPADTNSYSVYISEEDVSSQGFELERHLRGIPQHEIERMRNNIISMIPRLVYMHKSDHDDVADAFDVSIHGVLQRIASLKMASGPQ